MTEDPNKKNNQQSNQSGRQGGQTGQEETGQHQKDKGDDNFAQKRPTQGGHDVETDQQDEQNKGGQRRAS